MVKYLGKAYLFYLVVLLNIYLINCLIEIPLKAIEVRGVPKHKHKKPKETNKSNKIILVEEGDIIANPSRIYVANIKIGSDEQKFNLILDTGSSDLWVAGEGSQDTFEIFNHYSPSSSSEKTNEEFGILYGTGAVKGYYYKDYIKYINDKKFKMKFGVANSTAFNAGADGIVGLANYYSDESLSFIRMMKEEGVTDSLSFSFKFEGQLDGKMYIGKHDDFSSSNTVSCSIINKEHGSYWIATVDGFSVKKSDNEIKSSKSYEILFDTGTNVIDLPYDYLKDIESDLSEINCKTYTEDNDEYQIKCKASSDGSLPDFRFKINNAYLTVSYNYSFYRKSSDKDYYYSRVYFMKTDTTYIIGSPFFVSIHTLFDGDDGKLRFYSENNVEKKGLSTLAIILIILAVIIVLAVLGVLIYIFIRKRKQKRKLEEQSLLNNYI